LIGANDYCDRGHNFFDLVSGSYSGNISAAINDRNQIDVSYWARNYPDEQMETELRLIASNLEIDRASDQTLWNENVSVRENFQQLALANAYVNAVRHRYVRVRATARLGHRLICEV
jgi:hypothetical protein